MFRRSRRLLFVALLAVAAFAPLSAAQACPGCKEATSEQGANLARGYSYSILFMMPIPFLILGSFGGYVYYTVRKRDAQSPQTASPASENESPAGHS